MGPALGPPETFHGIGLKPSVLQHVHLTRQNLGIYIVLTPRLVGIVQQHSICHILASNRPKPWNLHLDIVGLYGGTLTSVSIYTT